MSCAAAGSSCVATPGACDCWCARKWALLAVILVYCVTRLGSFDEGIVLDNLTPEMEAILKENGLARADIVPAVQMMFYAAYGTVAFVTVLFQGGLALYYRSRTARVTEALATPPAPTNPPVL